MTFLGTISAQKAILTLQKTAFDMSSITSINQQLASSCVKLIHRNDIYRTYIGRAFPSSKETKATLIFPATDVHVRKYTKQQRRMISETPEIYDKYVEDYIQSMKGDRIQWYVPVMPYITNSCCPG